MRLSAPLEPPEVEKQSRNQQELGGTKVLHSQILWFFPQGNSIKQQCLRPSRGKQIVILKTSRTSWLPLIQEFPVALQVRVGSIYSWSKFSDGNLLLPSSIVDSVSQWCWFRPPRPTLVDPLPSLRRPLLSNCKRVCETLLQKRELWKYRGF